MHFWIVSYKDRSVLLSLTHKCGCSFFSALHFHMRPNISLTMPWIPCISVQKFNRKCTLKSIVQDIQTQTVIHWPTELQKTKELQTNLIIDAISPHCLPPILSHRHKSTHILERCDTAITAVIWCTEMYISHPQRMQDNISLKRQISLQIKIPSSMSGCILRRKKSQKQTATRH